jgi:hypothetical protein
MSRFLAGFAVASVLWGGALALYLSGVLEGAPEEPVGEIEPAFGDEVVEAPPEDTPRMRRGRRRGGRSSGGGGPTPLGNAITGDDLGDPGALNLDLGDEGGEERIPGHEIEAAMDEAFPRVRRCLVLAAGEDRVTGRLTFGLRIEPNGSVSRVNLSGPAAVTTGECGDCLRGAVRGIRFRSFDGPPMVVRYPISLE